MKIALAINSAFMGGFYLYKAFLQYTFGSFGSLHTNNEKFKLIIITMSNTAVNLFNIGEKAGKTKIYKTNF